MNRLDEKFRSGEFVRPDGGPNLVDLAQALAGRPGAVSEAIGPADHLVFVLVDGLGTNLLPANSFLGSHLKMSLRSVFPSSTAPAITTLATGTWPGRHAVLAWWTNLPWAGATATILKYADRFTGAPLAADPARVYPEPSLVPRIRRDVRSYQPAPIIESPYSKYARGGTAGEGYATLREAVDSIARRVAAATSPTYTYLYYPAVDAAEHTFGPWAPEVKAQVDAVDRELARLEGRARLVVSADHGQIEVPDAEKRFLAPDDPLLEFLHAPPAGEMRFQTWHAKPGFAERFRDRFGARFELLTPDEAAPLLGGLTEEARARLGDWVSVALDGGILFYGPPAFHREEAAMRGFHGGLTPDEMFVPLVVA